MNTQTQDLAWACLPKAARMAARETYRLADREYKFHYGKRHAFETMFGKHNLTSDTEPEELLMVERNLIMEQYKKNLVCIRKRQDFRDQIFSKAANDTLVLFFGDKCLPDNLIPSNSTELNSDKELNEDNFAKSDTPNTPNSGELKSQSAENQPKFHKGAIVRVISDDKYGVVSHIVKNDEEDDGVFYTLDGIKDWRFLEKNLEPYTETSNVSADETKDDTKDNMEEKELNLCELLKGCEGEKFFSISVGEVMFKAIYDYDDTHKVRTIRKDAVGNEYNVNFHSDGKRNKSGLPDLYPSEDLLKKYPLDAYSAWMEWKESRKPKYILQAEIRLISNSGKTIEDYENVEVEVSDVDLTQAAEAVRECLEKFHKEHGEK